MSKRSRIIGATIMTIMAVLSISLSAIGSTDLQAAGLNEVGYDFTKIFIGASVGLLTLSALFFVSASGD